MSAAAFDLPAATSRVATDVRRGLLASPKALPPYLFYDAAGSELYERITDLPEYYLTRAERSIFEAHADAFVERAIAYGGHGTASGRRGTLSGRRPMTVVELGAGSAAKTELVLRAVLHHQPRCLYVPVDVSFTAIEDARARLAGSLPAVRVKPLVMTHEDAANGLRGVPGPQLLLFIGSSVGNFEDEEASSLLGSIRHALGQGAVLLLGTDLRKSPEVLIPAYDDGAGVTAAFNKNVLTRINRELGGHFDLARFKHVARWNDAASRIEMHLESTARQDVPLDALGLRVAFEAGETIHTESSIKYDLPRVDRLLEAAGFRRDETYYDDAKRFAVHLARTA